MEVVAAPDHEEMSQAAAQLIIEAVATSTACTLMLAMGRSPLRVYSILSERVAERQFDVGALTIVQLDEYWGLGPHDERSLGRWLDQTVIEPWGVGADQVVRFDVDVADPFASCRDYAERIKAKGGIDLAVLGIGPNGHLGFNEPPSGPGSPTRPLELTPASIRSNGSYWDGEDRSPRLAVTAGMDIILAARRVVLLASGADKHSILRRALLEPPSPEVPASYLQTHSDLTVLADRDAWTP